jgi:hypothetical protein
MKSVLKHVVLGDALCTTLGMHAANHSTTRTEPDPNTKTHKAYAIAMNDMHTMVLAPKRHAYDGAGAKTQILHLEEAPDIIANMLRWMLLITEIEDPPIVDIIAGYDFYNRLLLT